MIIFGKNITLNKNGKILLKNISFQITKAKITTFIGGSGAGKTSLLRCLANIYSTYDGELKCENTDVKNLSNIQRAKMLGFVSQHLNLFPHMTVLQNCMHPLVNVLGMPLAKAQDSALGMLDFFSIIESKNAYPKNLSGGQVQRVAIARALCLEPKVIVLDEPTSALDVHNVRLLQNLLQHLCDKGVTIILSSHDLFFVKEIMNKVYLMDDGCIVDEYNDSSGEICGSNKIKAFLDA